MAILQVVEVDDVDDPRLDDYRRLNDPAERRRVERAGEFFIAEGELVIRTVIATRAQWPIRSVLVTPQRHEAMADALEDVAPVYVAPLDVLRAVSGFDVHRGALASAQRTPPRDAATVLAHAGTVVVLEAVSDHENLGALFRNVAALAPSGSSSGGAVLLGPRTGDPLYRRSLRVSMGHALRVPFARIDDLQQLDDAGYCIAALTPSRNAEPITSLPRGKVALLLGAEGPGLTEEWLARAHQRVCIPMNDGVDSLNVAVAAAIALYELRRFEDVG